MFIFVVEDEDAPAPGVRVRGCFSSLELATKFIAEKPGECNHDQVVPYEIDSWEYA